MRTPETFDLREEQITLAQLTNLPKLLDKESHYLVWLYDTFRWDEASDDSSVDIVAVSPHDFQCLRNIKDLLCIADDEITDEQADKLNPVLESVEMNPTVLRTFLDVYPFCAKTENERFDSLLEVTKKALTDAGITKLVFARIY